VQDLVEDWRDIVWIRANEIDSLNDQEGKLELFKDKVEPNDIE